MSTKLYVTNFIDTMYERKTLFGFALLVFPNSSEAREGLESSRSGSTACKVLLVLVSTNATILSSRSLPTRPVLSVWR